MRKRLIIISGLVLLLVVYVLGIRTGQYITKKAPQAASALAEPNMSQEAILVWANEAATAVFSYDFANYRRDFQHAQEYFTPEGWQNYKEAFDKTGTLKMVINQKLTVSAIPTGTPVIITQGVEGNKYTWKVELPVLVVYKGAKSSTEQKLLITMSIQRTKEYLGKRGVGIFNFISVAK